MKRRWVSATLALSQLQFSSSQHCIVVSPTSENANIDTKSAMTSLHDLGCGAAELKNSATTLQQARDMARELRANAPSRGTVNVVLLPGRHRLREPLQLSHKDSNTTWRAAIPGSSIVSGDETITGWTACPSDIVANASSPVLCAPVNFTDAATLAQSRQLFAADGRRILRGRSAQDVVTAFQQPISVDLDKYTVAHEDLPKWIASGSDNVGAIEMVYTAEGSPWTESRCTVLNVSHAGDESSYHVFMKQPCFQSLQQKPCGQGTSTPSAIENAHVDDLQPGQWFLHHSSASGVGQECAANFGETHACCGQPGNVSADSGFVCPATAPVCTGYVYDDHWGTCELQDNGSVDDSGSDSAACTSSSQCTLPCPASEVGKCVDQQCQCVPSAPSELFAVYYPLNGETVQPDTVMHMPTLESLSNVTGSSNVAFEGMSCCRG